MFKFDSALVRFLNFLADIFILHLLWFVHSIPIITIGASTTALYYSMMKRLNSDEGEILNNFRQSFKSNFKKSTIIWIIVLIISFILAIDFRFSLLLKDHVRAMMLTAYVVVFIPFCFTVLYVFAVQAKFENTIINTIKNAFIMSILNLPYTILLIIIPVIYFIACIYIPMLLFLLFALGSGLYAFVACAIFNKIFKKYI